MSNNRSRVFLFLLASVASVCFAAPNPHVVLNTNAGDITIELYPEAAPITVDNFLDYVNSGFYNYLLFHRVIPGFMIQAGGFYYNSDDGKFYKAPTSDPIINESDNGLSNLRGTIAMARLGDDPEGNPQPNSATSQFFINHVDNPGLDRANAPDGYGYCVFGLVVEGMDVVDTIAQVPTAPYYQPDPEIYFEAMPQQLVGMYSAYVLPCDTSYCSDLTQLGQIHFEDFAVIASRWLDDCGSANGFCDGADLDYSGTVDMIDLELFLWHWTQTAGYEPQFSDLAVNNDIDIDDLAALMNRWLDSDCHPDNNYCDQADINRDGTVNLVDYSLLSSNWLISY